MASPPPPPSLAGRLRSRLRRSVQHDNRPATAAAAAASVAAAEEASGSDEQDEFAELQLHPDLDDCAELSELLLPGVEEHSREPGMLESQDQPLQHPMKELQAQLMALAIENEALRTRASQAESDQLRELRRQLATEQTMRRQAETAAVDAAAARPAGPISRAVARLRRRRAAARAAAATAAASAALASSGVVAEGVPAGGPPVPDGVDLESLDSDSSVEDEAGDGVNSGRRTGLVARLRAWTAGRLLDLLEDLQPDSEAPAGSTAAATAEADEPLSARRLKTNAKRFGRSARPLIRCLAGFRGVVRWSSPSYTCLVAVVYYFALRYNLLLPLLLLLCISRLGLNYLKYRRHWSLEFNFLSDYETPEEEEASEKERTVGTQVNFVVQVARKVQNLTGKLSDNMEKFKNLVTWRSPKHTQTLLNALMVAFAVSIVLPATTCLYYAGIYIGIKLLAIDALLMKYPRLRRRYDRFGRLWHSLPTDQQLGYLDASRDVAKYILPYSDGERAAIPADAAAPAGGSPLASDDEQFHQVFALPNLERPLARWRGGKRCAIICKDAERTLPLPSSLKHGKLFLTRSFLCFERGKDRGKARKRNLVMPLAMIRWVKKTKPFAWFPGGGMSIEVQIIGIEKPITFGAIIGRDEAFDSLTEAGKKAGLAWAGGSGSGGDTDIGQKADPQLVQSVTQALMSDSDIED